MNSTAQQLNPQHPDRSSSPSQWWALFIVLCSVPFAIAWSITKSLALMVSSNDTFSQIPLILLVSVYLIYVSRKSIFARTTPSVALGSATALSGFLLVILARLNPWSLGVPNQGSLFVLGAVIVFGGAFLLCFGQPAFRAARFPIFFLLFAIPIPEPFLSEIVAFLQQQSANAAEWFFRVGGIPFLRKGLVFDLPGVSILVAEECSGIRSTLALMVTTVLACHLFLRTTWRKLILIALVVPVAIVKNGLRIAGLSTLAIYVNPEFLTGPLHHRGGIVFFVIALLPMALLLFLFERGERKQRAVIPAKTAGAET